MYARYLDKLRWSYRKNRTDVKGIIGRDYPEFVLSRENRPIRDEVPVFVFHQVEPRTFRAQLAYLARNGYTTLSGDELLRVIEGKQDCPARSIVLTFDDGMASLYSVAYPLLKEFNFRAISFIIPGCIPNAAPETPTYEDVRAGRADREDILRREAGDYPLCSWQEIYEMHASGIVEFQAHSMHHHLIHVSSRLVDFIHPNYDCYFANFKVPVYTVDDRPDYSREVAHGAPVFWAEPRLSGVPQYFDSEEVRAACISFVDDHGGVDFFERSGWRRKLKKFYFERRGASNPGTYETSSQTRQAIFNDVLQCKKAIEERLPEAKVEHFCFPWYTGSDVAVEEAERAGYRALYWGMLDEVEANRPGGDPLRIVRLEDSYIFRLPGEGRRAIREILAEKIASNLPV